MGTKAEELKNKVTTQAQGVQVQQQKPTGSHSLKALMADDKVKNRFNEVLGKRAPQFMASIINLANGSPELQVADGMSIIQSAMVAAALNLPVDKNLGYMWIIGRKDKNRGGLVFASPQIGYKGFIQLALRTGQYANINVFDVYEGEFISWNRITEELVTDSDKQKSNAIVGYGARFKLLNGFTKTVYWTKADVEKHKSRFSKTDKLWNTDWDAMARKTVLKSMLSLWGILSIEMQNALAEDNNAEREEVGDGSVVGGGLGDVFDISATTTVNENGDIIDVTPESTDLP
jgi:recombination protein RecT